MVDILPKPTDHAADKDNVELWIYVDDGVVSIF
jgi:hypothetical protein